MKEFNEIENRNPFKVPENYFDDLKDRISGATKGVSPASEKTGLLRRLNPVLAVAAAIALIVTVSTTTIYFISGNRDELAPVEITDDIFTSIYLNDIDISILEEKVIENESFLAVPEVNSKDLIEYLILENIDIYDIYDIYELL